MESTSSPSLPDVVETLRSLRWVDHVGFGIAFLFLILGAVRGLWWQVVRLVGLAAAVALARLLAPAWGPAFQEVSGLSPVMAQGLVWIGLFVVGLVIASLLGLVGKKSLDAMQLGLVDRFGGALAGVVTGLLLHSALLLCLCYVGPQPWTRNELAGTWSERLVRVVATRSAVLLDSDSSAARSIREWLGGSFSPTEESEAPQSTGEVR